MYEYYIAFKLVFYDTSEYEVADGDCFLKVDLKLDSAGGINNAKKKILTEYQKRIDPEDIGNIILTWFKLLEGEN